MFLQDSYYTSVSPNTMSILTVKAVDEDYDGSLQYSLVRPSEIFSIDRLSGRLSSSNGKLRFGKHVVEVSAEDQGRRLTKVMCVVFVDKVFTDTFLAITFSEVNPTLKEDVPVGTFVTKVHVNEANMKFSIVGGNTDHVFHISPHGNVTVSKPLDYEKTASYEIAIRVTCTQCKQMQFAKEVKIISTYRDQYIAIHFPKEKIQIYVEEN